MAQIDKTKEEIGWLKTIFALLIAIDVSLIGWLAQNSLRISNLLLGVSAVLILSIRLIIIVINLKAYQKINKLGEME